MIMFHPHLFKNHMYFVLIHVVYATKGHNTVVFVHFFLHLFPFDLMSLRLSRL